MSVVHIPAWSSEYNHGFIGGLYIRPFGPMKKGTVSDGHEHYIDHATFVEQGSVGIEWRSPDGERSGIVEIGAPNFITIKANAWHKITALEDDTRYRCIFAAAEAEKLDEGPVPYMMERPRV